MPAHYYDTPADHAKALCDNCHEACQKEGWKGYKLLNPKKLEGSDATACDHCGGDGCIDYLDGDGGDWGEDCPSEENHLIICRHCGGTGYVR